MPTDSGPAQRPPATRGEMLRLLPLERGVRERVLAESGSGFASGAAELATPKFLVGSDRGARLFERWRRSQRLGADPVGYFSGSSQAIVSEESVREAHERTELVRVAAESVLGEFARRCDRADHVAVLTDTRGVIAQVAGGGSFAEEARDLRLIEGAAWSEELRGTNAIGTALAEKRPVLVDGEAHFALAIGGLACIAAPILDPSGRVLAVLDATARAPRLGALQTSVLLDIVRAIEELIRIRVYAGTGAAPGRRGGLALVERLMERARGPAFLLERPGRIVRRNRAALALEVELGHEAQLPTFDELLAVSEGRGSASWVPAGHSHAGDPSNPSAAHWSVDAEPILDGRGEALGIVVFLEEPSKASSLPSAGAPQRPDSFAALTGEDPGFTAAIATARRLASSRLPVLLVAETGTGKDLFARAIHSESDRAMGPFVALNCGAIHADLLLAEFFGHGPGAFTGASRSGRDGALHAASGGTLFLDEIADLSSEGQAALLRVLESGTFSRIGETHERTVDLRIVAATSRDLTLMVEEGRFRQDLFYRLGGSPISIPPLRERTDIAALARYLWHGMAREHGSSARLGPSAMHALLAHAWPGNVRELRSVLEYAAIMVERGAIVERAHLPETVQRASEAKNLQLGEGAEGERVESSVGPHGQRAVREGIEHDAPTMDRLRKQALEEALSSCNGNVSAAARELGIARSTIYRMAKRFGLQV